MYPARRRCCSSKLVEEILIVWYFVVSSAVGIFGTYSSFGEISVRTCSSKQIAIGSLKIFYVVRINVKCLCYQCGCEWHVLLGAGGPQRRLGTCCSGDRECLFFSNNETFNSWTFECWLTIKVVVAAKMSLNCFFRFCLLTILIYERSFLFVSLFLSHRICDYLQYLRSQIENVDRLVHVLQWMAWFGVLIKGIWPNREACGQMLQAFIFLLHHNIALLWEFVRREF